MYSSITYFPDWRKGPTGFFRPSHRLRLFPPLFEAKRVAPPQQKGSTLSSKRVYPLPPKGSTPSVARGQPFQVSGVYPFRSRGSTLLQKRVGSWGRKSGEFWSKEWGVWAKGVGSIDQPFGRGAMISWTRDPCNNERSNTAHPSGIKFAKDNYQRMKRRKKRVRC